jgi:2-dehydro-3-deoxyphosphooctonate aldolase (KDO 8-P synthase)
MTREFEIGPLAVGGRHPLLVMAGPCVIEDLDLMLTVARSLKQTCAALGLGYVFKASYDKANRTSVRSFRGPGLEEGLELLRVVKEEVGVPVVSDVHDIGQVDAAARVLDVIQIPAFLSRQTDLIQAAARTGRVVNVKKGQFLSPYDMAHVVEKVTQTGNDRLILTERGASFGYNNLVVDMRSFAIMRSFGFPVVFDATHSVQLPGAGPGQSGGDRRFIAPLARAAVAAGVDGVFLEVHPNPAQARCDGPNSLPLDDFSGLIQTLAAIDRLIQPEDTP